MAKLTVRDLDVAGKEVLMRVDFNVPMKDGKITNDARIVAALPTIKYLLENGARLVLCSHLGRPEGTGYQAEFSLAAAAECLSGHLGKPVAFVPETIGEAATAARAALIKENPAYGTIICRCESITEGEIIDAIHRVPGARSIDGVKRRTRAGMGRCQGGFCCPRVIEILSRELGIPMEEVTKAGGNSKIIVGTNKDTI